MKAKSEDYKRGYRKGSADMHEQASRRFAEANAEAANASYAANAFNVKPNPANPHALA